MSRTTRRRLPRRAPAISWPAFLDEFHHGRPGITAQILQRCTGDGRTPYEWLVDHVPVDGIVVDVACGNGPVAELVGDRWIGVDRSAAELADVAEVGLGRVARGDATALPIRSQVADAVVCSMALQVVQPLDAVAAEIARVVRAGGRIVALLPGRGPLSFRDRWRYLRLMIAVRDRLSAPNGHALAARTWEPRAGLHRDADQPMRFEYAINDAADAERFVDSLYLPTTATRQVAAGRAVARRWIGTRLGIPLRCVVWTVDDTPTVTMG